MPGLLSLEKVKPIYKFIVVGLGATGSHFFRSLCQDIYTRDKQGSNSYDRFRYTSVVLVDGDKVEKKNVGNQLFLPDDVGEFKVQVLQEAYRTFYKINTLSYTDYVKDEDTMVGLMELRYDEEIPVLIGLVDNNETRQMFDRLFRSDRFESMIYIDVGIHSVDEKDGKFDFNTGNNGQVVCGFKYKNQIILEPLSAWFPNVMTDRDSPAPGCGVVIESVPQRLTTNKFAAQIISNVTSSLIYENSIFINMCTFDARMNGARPTFVTMEQQGHFEQLLGGDGDGR